MMIIIIIELDIIIIVMFSVLINDSIIVGLIIIEIDIIIKLEMIFFLSIE